LKQLEKDLTLETSHREISELKFDAPLNA